MPEIFDIQLMPHGRHIKGTGGRSLMEALVDHSIFLRSDCGGRGVCGKCRVNQIAADGSSASVTSCNLEITGDLQIEIPESSMLSSHIITKAPVAFPASYNSRTIGSGAAACYGIATDLGTTTIAVYLCNMTTGEVLSSIAVKNPQALYGDDIMSRIGAIDQDDNNLKQLQKLVVKAIEWGIGELLKVNHFGPEIISKMVTVGNPTMIHIFAGVSPEPIGTFPFQPAFKETRISQSTDLGFSLAAFPIQTLANVAGFIGGDIISASIAVDIEDQPEGTLLIDLGTNGELVLKGKDKLFATSCATGPAFEGASLSCGMQAIPGAINKVLLETAADVPTFTIINPKQSTTVKPSGLCGTGVISGVAQLCLKRIIEPGGAFRKDLHITALQQDASGHQQYTLVQGDSSQDGLPVYISQKDIRSVQLGKGALITGIDLLLKAAGYEKPTKIIVAGAFGAYIEKEDMITLGMIPALDLDKIEVSGNSAGAGAIMVLCHGDYLKKSMELADKITIVDLVHDPKFQDIFVQNLSFPF